MPPSRTSQERSPPGRMMSDRAFTPSGTRFLTILAWMRRNAYPGCGAHSWPELVTSVSAPHDHTERRASANYSRKRLERPFLSVVADTGVLVRSPRNRLSCLGREHVHV